MGISTASKGDIESANVGMAEVLYAGAVQADVMGGPRPPPGKERPQRCGREARPRVRVMSALGKYLALSIRDEI